jgi:hypothetical protein
MTAQLLTLCHEGDDLIKRGWKSLKDDWLLGSKTKEDEFLKPFEQYQEFFEHFTPDF